MNTKTSWNPKSVWNWLILILLFIAILLPRLLRLDQYVTTDETLWLHRSANFYYALGQREFEHTYQDKHPGATIMWAGTFGFLFNFPEYRGMGQGYYAPLDFHSFLDDIEKEPLELLVASRVFVILVTAITLTAAFLITSQLIGLFPALIVFLLIVFDPFFIALNTILHPDALLPSLMLLSTVAYIAYLTKGRKQTYLIISAAAAGWSWMTKYPGLFLIPFMGLITMIDAVKKDAHWKNWIKNILTPLLLWMLISVVVFFVCWPAMWVTPLQTLSSISNAFNSGFSSVNETSFTQNWDTVTSAIPNPSFYPKQYLWRSTPTDLIGLVIAIISTVVFHKRDQEHRILFMLFLFAFFYVLGLSFGNLKANRYIGVVFPVLALAAGIGWVIFIDELLYFLKSRFNFTHTKGLQVLLVVGILLSQILLVVQAYPYYWAYYNPLLGGTRRAVDNVDIGYGEGLDQAAAYIETKPNANELTVLSWYGTGPFSYYSSSHVLDMLIRDSWGSSNAKRLDESQYVVTYVFQWQKEMTKELIETLSQIEPEHTVVINGADYVRVYHTDDIPPDDWEKLLTVGD